GDSRCFQRDAARSAFNKRDTRSTCRARNRCAVGGVVGNRAEKSKHQKCWRETGAETQTVRHQSKTFLGLRGNSARLLPRRIRAGMEALLPLFWRKRCKDVMSSIFLPMKRGCFGGGLK